MIACFFDRDQRVLLVRFTAVFDEADVEQHRRLRQRFRDIEGDGTIIVDLSGVERVAIATDRIAAASRRASSTMGQSGIVIATPGTEVFGLARMFSMTRGGTGHAVPELVRSMDEALRSLGLSDPRFAPWPTEPFADDG